MQMTSSMHSMLGTTQAIAPGNLRGRLEARDAHQPCFSREGWTCLHSIAEGSKHVLKV